jgi:hypothetical protein
MELNKKILAVVLSQIKAHKDVIVFQDSPVDGCLDILYAPKYPEAPRAVHRMTMRAAAEIDLFEDAPVEKMKSPVPVYLPRIRAALKNDDNCVFENGCINGIRVEVDKADSPGYCVFEAITEQYSEFLGRIEEIGDSAAVSMGRADWENLISECAKFVSSDPIRYYMNGICFDFFYGGEDCIHMAATDGRKLILIKQKANHKKFISEAGQFLVFPAYLFVPKSDYNLARIRLTGGFGQLLISTEDYRFEGVFECVDSRFPNYPKVIPEITEKSEWFTLRGASLHRIANTAKIASGRKPEMICLNAENPESLSITLNQDKTAFKVEGTASRPMRVEFLWENLSACLPDSETLTKFNLNGSGEAILAREPETETGKGRSLDTTKVFMPVLDRDRYADCDNFCIPKPKVQKPELDTAPKEIVE